MDMKWEVRDEEANHCIGKSKKGDDLANSSYCKAFIAYFGQMVSRCLR